ncbi:ATP-binding protein [Actinoplanes sp. NPDC049548]|uniref:sensor histidine kinase n=1 Tax=Actinoplanes sp. NPDC049548 TaxID=3155152 RepID=UPI0034494C1C
MTLLYGTLFAVVTTVVLVVVQRFLLAAVRQKVQGIPLPSPAVATTQPPPVRDSDLQHSIAAAQEGIASTQRALTLATVVVVAVLAFVVCWWLTGRLLRPLQRINGTARRLSLSNLHERIALTGPDDELKDLADTFDAMLDRLERGVEAQRRFAANVSHELRTPLAVQRTAVEVGLADPTPERLARVRRELLRTTERSERLIEGLLALAQGERGLQDPGPVDLAALTTRVVEQHRAAAERAGVRLDVTVGALTVTGDEVMLAQLVGNLVQNAVRYNEAGGSVAVTLSSAGGLSVRNTGPRVPPERVDELFEPFRRLHAERTGPAEGAGLGLSIVVAIAGAHGGEVGAAANPDGGLTVTVTFRSSRGPRSG